MSYRAIAPLVLVKVPGPGDTYRVDYHYYGSIIPSLTDEQRERFLAEGFVEEVDAADEPPAGDGKPPRKTAPQGDWAVYAISKGADPQEASASSRQDLIELYGG